MNETERKEAVEDIRRLIRNINEAWTQGRPEQLSEFFHEDMVIAGPNFQDAGRGREACVASFQNFVGFARILGFEESEFRFEIWGDTALASYRFTIDYSVEGEALSDTGYDVYLFVQEEGRWRAVWRTLLPLQTEPESS
jgi:ketosteroid isomerase-like protein